MVNRWGDSGNIVRLYFLGSKNTADGDCNHEIKRFLLLVRKAMTKFDSILKSWDMCFFTNAWQKPLQHCKVISLQLIKIIGKKKQRHYFANKGPSSQGYGFSSTHVWMWELDHKESWALKNWCFWTVVLEKTLEIPLDWKGIQPVNPKGNQSWIFIGRTDAEAETPILCPPDVKNWLIWKDPDAGNDWRQKERGRTENEMTSPTGWTWAWTSYGIWWSTGKPGMLQSMGSQRIGQTEQLDWTELS